LKAQLLVFILMSCQISNVTLVEPRVECSYASVKA
jgi:hypothetical protein